MWAFLLWFAVVASAAEPLGNGPGVNLLGGPSRDGKILSYVDPATRNLAIRDLAIGQSRTLTQQKVASTLISRSSHGMRAGSLTPGSMPKVFMSYVL
jgi:hypothetical protein